MISLFSNDKLVQSETIKSILDNVLSPRLFDSGFRYNGNNLWFTDRVDGIRNVVKYQTLKGETGILEWGVCLDFVPSISGKTLKFHKTESAVTLHLFELPKDYAASFIGESTSYSCVSHWGLAKLEKTLVEHYNKNKQNIMAWIANNDSIDSLIETALYQIHSDRSSVYHHPSPSYVLAFLYSRANRVDEAVEIIDSLELDLNIRSKIMRIINIE